MMFNSTFNNVVAVSFIGGGSRSTMIKPPICEIAHVMVKLNHPPFSNVFVPSQESDRLCICVLGVLSSPLSLILIFDFGKKHVILLPPTHSVFIKTTKQSIYMTVQ